MAAKPRVVVVGAGFAGVFAARELAGGPCDVLLLDRNNAHAFLPLLYQVATAAVEAAHIAAPVRAVIRSLGRRAANLDFLMAEARGVDFAARTLLAVDQDGREHTLPYDYLLLAPGSVTNTFGVPGADSRAFSLKNLEEAVRLRNHILRSFEAAAWARDEDERQHRLCFAVVGGGPTGVELAGAMAELMAGSLARDFPRLGLCRPCVTLIEAGDGLLPGFPEGLRAYAAAKLRRLGVDVRTAAQVAEVTGDGALLGDGRLVRAGTVVWTAGVKGEPLAGRLGLKLGPGGQAYTRPTLQAVEHPEVFLAGDCARVEWQGRALPMFAPPAIQAGRHAAQNILRLIRGEAPRDFRYRDKGMMATIGRKAAVVRLGRFSFKGLPAWLLWLAVHLAYLIGFRNRLFVLVGWAVDYFRSERAARVISRRDPLC